MKEENRLETKQRVQLKRMAEPDLHQRIHGASLVISLIIAGLLTAWAVMERGLLVEARAGQASEQIAEQVLRFHVLADSDSERDQQVKMQVKSAVISYLQEEMGEKRSLSGTKEFVRTHLEEIRELAEQTVRRENSGDAVTAELVTDEFPEKTYGDVTFPKGNYEALRIRIGSGEGHNWWCCLYPNLCFTDAVCGQVVPEDKEELEGVLDEDAYEMITCTSDFRIKWFFLSKGQDGQGD